MTLSKKQQAMTDSSKWDFSDLKAIFINCTLKKPPELSHTEGLMAVPRSIMEKNGVSVETLRAVDFDIASGVYPDMTEHNWAHDDWPRIYEKCWRPISW